MPSSTADLNLEPCPDCPIPMNVVITLLPKAEDEVECFAIDCRECGDKWVEKIYE